MKFPIASLVLLCGMAAAAASADPPAAPPASVATASTSAPLSKWQQYQRELFNASAPADEYFGRMKMSYLGMNNTFHDAAISAGDQTTDPRVIGKVALAEDALDDWANKYPHDPQLARTYFLAVQVERKIWTAANQDRAWIYFNRIVALFPDSYFGKVLKRDIAIGFTEHYYANPVPCATPVPIPPPADPIAATLAIVAPPVTATPTPGPRSRRGSPTPAPAPTPSPDPTATPSPVPTPIQTTLQKGLSVVIIPQACVPAETPPPRLPT